MSGAYRDTGAAIERAEALEREVEELKAEVARLRTAPAERKNAEPKRLPPNVQRLENDLVDARAENELLRSALAKLEARLGEAPDPDDVEQDRVALLRDLRNVRRELADVRTELDNAQRAIEMREEEIDRLRARRLRGRAAGEPRSEDVRAARAVDPEPPREIASGIPASSETHGFAKRTISFAPWTVTYAYVSSRATSTGNVNPVAIDWILPPCFGTR